MYRAPAAGLPFRAWGELEAARRKPQEGGVKPPLLS